MVTRKSIITLYGLWPDLTEYTKKLFGKLHYSIHPETLTLSTLDPTTEILVVFIDSKITEEIMEHLPNLRYITTMSTGFDHIDVAAAQKRGIVVSNLPAYGENTVAEHTFALILGLTRKLFDSVKRVKEGRYDFSGLRGTDLKGKTLGVVGTGHIGAHVARIAKGFEMNVLAYDVKKNQKLAKKIGFEYVSLNSLLKKSNIITLHLPLFPATYHLINKKNIKLFKTGSFLINTARGGLVEPEALLEGLKTGKLAGVGLDVLEDEHLLQNFEEVMRCSNNKCKLRTSLINNLLIDHPKVIITPHNAFNSTEALERIITVTVENIKNFIAGLTQNQIN
jgi:D-lactate dehydrogenase